VIPQDFVLDDQEGIKEPAGMSGVRLEARVHIVTGAVTSAQNIVKCANRCGLNVADIVLQPLASSLAVLTEDERELGVCLVDIGGGTTDIAIFHEGSLVHTAVIGVGGNALTNDISVGLRAPADEAEKIKQKYGCAMKSMVASDEKIEVANVGGGKPRLISRSILCEIIEPRVEEVFQLVQREIQKSGYEEQLASGVVITGGSTLLQGMTELAEEVTGLQVRQGVPRAVGGLVDVVRSPMYATGVGLVLYGNAHLDARFFKIRDENIYSKVVGRMQKWLSGLF
jgi:cell division protein FtsA